MIIKDSLSSVIISRTAQDWAENHLQPYCHRASEVCGHNQHLALCYVVCFVCSAAVYVMYLFIVVNSQLLICRLLYVRSQLLVVMPIGSLWSK